MAHKKTEERQKREERSTDDRAKELWSGEEEATIKEIPVNTVTVQNETLSQNIKKDDMRPELVSTYLAMSRYFDYLFFNVCIC